MTKPGYPIQVWSNLRTLAGLLRYFNEHGYTPKSRSDLGATAIEQAHYLLMRDSGLVPFETAEEALVYMAAYDFGPGDVRQQRAALAELNEEE